MKNYGVVALAVSLLVCMSAPAQELLFFDMDKFVTINDQGFPKGNNAPAGNNCNWESQGDGVDESGDAF